MNCYVDTSVLVALCVKEPRSADVTRWYTRTKDKLVVSVWAVTEFASAMGIKQRTGQLGTDEAAIAWQSFQRLCINDLHLLNADADLFHKAALLTLNAQSSLRAGDALHLATALQTKVKRIATLDMVLAANCKSLKIAQVKF